MTTASRRTGRRQEGARNGSDGMQARRRHPSAYPDLDPGERDPLGKLALFSSERQAPSLGQLFMECSSCRRETPVTLPQLVKAGLPVSLHVPLVHRYHSLMRCPACGRRTWVRLRWRLD